MSITIPDFIAILITQLNNGCTGLYYQRFSLGLLSGQKRSERSLFLIIITVIFPGRKNKIDYQQRTCGF